MGVIINLVLLHLLPAGPPRARSSRRWWGVEPLRVVVPVSVKAQTGEGRQVPEGLSAMGEGNNNWGRLFPLSAPGLLQVTLHGSIRPARF